MSLYESNNNGRWQGTRIQAIASDIPKPMISIDGIPVLEREIISLRDQGFTDIILTVGHMAGKIMHHFGNGRKFRTHIDYYVEKEPLGTIVVTNQPVISRGEVTFEGLETIHNKMEALLGKEGAYLDGIYFCPHHLHSGYEGEVKELKIDCDCRKPNPSMLLKAAEDLNIDLSQSYMVGDSENDILAGKAAGCKTVLLNTEGEYYGQDICVAGLNEFVDQYL